ncbi:MAG: SapC family protein [Magnetococcales bacterium]|nr:SapC family protein [Magnetococcales bacterium]
MSSGLTRLDPAQHRELTFTDCNGCTLCCDGTAFTVAFVPLPEIPLACRHFPVVFHKIGDNYWPGLFYTLKKKTLCLHLDPQSGRCQIYEERPISCASFPFHPSTPTPDEKPPFDNFPFVIEMDEQCPALQQDGDHSEGMAILESQKPNHLTEQMIQGFLRPERTDLEGQTVRFGRRLEGLGLLVKAKRVVKRPGKKKISQKYFVVDPTRWQDLAEADRTTLKEEGLELPILAHLESLGHFSRLEEMVLADNQGKVSGAKRRPRKK